MPDSPRRKLDRQRTLSLLRDARVIVWNARHRLALGLPLMLVNRLSGVVLPWLSKRLIDDVIVRHQHDLLWKIVFVGGIATVLGGITDYAIAQILGLAAQKSITDLRKKIQQHVQRLPVTYFDSTKTGVVVSRVMNDAEGIRNLVGTGLIQLVGGLVTAVIAIGILFYLSARLASIILFALIAFAAVLYWAFKTARPMFKKRSEVSSQLTGRLTEGISGIRIVKAYRAERHEARVFAKGAHQLLRLVVGTMRVISGVGALSTLLVGIVGIVVMVIGARQVTAGQMTVGGLVSFTLYLGLVVGPVVQIVSIGTQLSEAFAGLERMREVFAERPEDADDPEKEPIRDIDGTIELRHVTFEY